MEQKKKKEGKAESVESKDVEKQKEARNVLVAQSFRSTKKERGTFSFLGEGGGRESGGGRTVPSAV